MAPLLSLTEVHLAFGGPPVLEGVSLQVEKGERVGLLGRNGAGKSSLLALLEGTVAPDAGTVDRAPALRVARLPQDVPDGLAGTVREIVATGLGPLRAAVEDQGEWALAQRVDRVLQDTGLDGDAEVATLSGGLSRRVLLARALVSDPDVLLLDEPTNHLDLEAIEWLESMLLAGRQALVFVTHDRAFLRRLATRIVELDRGRLFDFACDYDTFVARKEALLEAEAKADARFDKRLAEEEVWIRQGIQARRTRNEGRVRALEAMRVARQARRTRTGQATLTLLEAERSGKLVVETEDLGFAYDGGPPVIRGLTTTLLRGDRVGIVGPNGAGKTTLLRVLLGELKPTSGRVRLGTNLEVLYLDQRRDTLDPERTVRWNLAGDDDFVSVGGERRHVIGYLQDFLFTPDRANSPVRILSGGEKSRLLLARGFTRPANVLVLDEPTNDLDLETLDLLEARLAAFTGTVLLVSHDRDFLDRVVTSTLVFEGGGRVAEYVGGYSDWVRQRPAPAVQGRKAKAGGGEAKAGGTKGKPKSPRPKKLGFKEKRELAELPGRIEALEQEQAALHARMADPALYRDAGAEVAKIQARLDALDGELEVAYARWAELDAIPE